MPPMSLPTLPARNFSGVLGAFLFQLGVASLDRTRLAAGHESVVERTAAVAALRGVEVEAAAPDTHASLSERDAELMGHPFSITDVVRFVVEEERLIVDFEFHLCNGLGSADQMEPVRSIFRDDSQERRTRHWRGTARSCFVFGVFHWLVSFLVLRCAAIWAVPHLIVRRTTRA